MGPLHPHDIRVARDLPVRHERKSWWSRFRDAIAAHVHVLSGHDEGCIRLGISVKVLNRFLHELVGEDAARFLGSGIAEVLAVHSGSVHVPGHSLTVLEEVVVLIQSKITPRKIGKGREPQRKVAPLEHISN